MSGMHGWCIISSTSTGLSSAYHRLNVDAMQRSPIKVSVAVGELKRRDARRLSSAHHARDSSDGQSIFAQQARMHISLLERMRRLAGGSLAQPASE